MAQRLCFFRGGIRRLRRGWGWAGAGLYCGDAGMEERFRAAAGRSDSQDGTGCEEGGEMELAVVWGGGERLVREFHVFTKYVKVTFLNGALLNPLPPGSGKDRDARWVDICEGGLDEEQMTEWVRRRLSCRAGRGFSVLGSPFPASLGRCPAPRRSHSCTRCT